MRPGSAVAALADAPVKRIPLVKARYNDLKPQNQVSYMMQAAGDVMPQGAACAKCSRRGGVYYGACVVVRDPTVMQITGGACANCWYSRQGSLCSNRVETTTAQDRTKIKRHGLTGAWGRPPATLATADHTPPAPEGTPQLSLQSGILSMSSGRAGMPQSPAQAATPQLPAPPGTPRLSVHPGYLAAIASGTVTHGSAPTAKALPKARATPAPTKNNPAPPVHNGLSGDDRVRAWEKRYRAMPTQGLAATHEHLVEWQEDLSTRLVAMNRVLLERLRESGAVKSGCC